MRLTYRPPVAPAELEGFLLDHPDVADVCVVGINDDYHGDLPLAFVVPSAAAQQRIKADPAEAQKLKTALIKVSWLNLPLYLQFSGTDAQPP